MKLGVITSLLFLVSIINSNAFIIVNWNSSAPYADSAGSAGLADGSVVQLIWSVDNVMDLVASDGSATGNDVVLLQGATETVSSWGGWIQGHTDDQFTFGDTGGLAADNAALVAGYVYIRVFDAQAGAIGVGTDYFQGGLIGGSLFDSPAAPQDYDETDPTGGSLTPMNMQVVPEPATMALFGLGLAVLGLRKRK